MYAPTLCKQKHKKNKKGNMFKKSVNFLKKSPAATAIIAAFILIMSTVAYKIVDLITDKIVNQWGEHVPVVSDNVMKERSERDLKVQSIIAELRAKLDADRVLVFGLHNGNMWSSGEPVIKYSVRYEIDKVGVAYVEDKLQNLLISQSPDLTSNLAINKPTIKNLEDTDNVGRARLTSFGVKTIIFQGIRPVDRTVGFVSVHFSNYKEFSAKDLEAFDFAVQQLNHEFFNVIK